MKKIINGIKYNTETAKEVGFYDNGLGYGDFHHVEETLYRKRNGKFFLYGHGGPASKYCVSVGTNEWSGGSDLIPLTEDEAKEWGEEHMSVEEYEDVFGEVEE